VDTSWPIAPSTPPPRRAKLDPVFSSAVDEAVEEALHPPEPAKSRGATKKHAAAKKAAPQRGAKAKREEGKHGDGKGTQAKTRGASAPPAAGPTKKQSSPPPAVNEPLAFINFVAAFTVGSTIEGEVVSFTSHGAMVDVSMPGGGALHCYIPLTAMGTPPPTKARQVLKKGEVRPFVLAGLDPPRRVAELALPRPASAGTRAGRTKAATPTRAAPAKKAAPAKEAAPKKAAAPAKKAAKKATAAKKAATAKKAAKAPAPTKKAAKAKKAPAKKAAKARPR